jgi:hypothetical protein
MWEPAERGEVLIGGCLIYGDRRDPSWSCRDCRYEFGHEPADRRRASRIIQRLLAEATHVEEP